MSDSISGLLGEAADARAHIGPGEEVAPADAPPPPSDPAADAEAAADSLRQQLAREKSARETAEAARRDAENRHRQAQTELHRTQQTVEDSNYTAIVTALNASNREVEALRAELRTAHSEGDIDKVADIQVKLGGIGATIRDLENGKQEMERARNARLSAPPKPEAPPAPSGDVAPTVNVSREQFMRSVAPTVADWLRKPENDQFFTDPQFYRYCVAADSLARAAGHDPNTADYIQHVERTLEQQGARPVAQSPTPQPAPARQSAPPAAAPPARQAPSMGSAQRSGDVQVTAAQRRTAEWMGVDPVAYAQEEQRLRSAGELPVRRR